MNILIARDPRRGAWSRRLLSVALTAAITACASTSHYAMPDVPTASRYPSDPRGGDAGDANVVSAAQFPASDVAADPWWQRFDDPRLDAFIADVLARNNDLATAALRVRRAQLDAGLSADALLPQLSGSVDSSDSRALDGDDDGQRSNRVGFSVRYEVDLWGRLRTVRNAAQLEAQATAEDREATALALVGTASRLYATLAFLNQRIAAADASLERVETTRRLVDVQYRAGAVSGLERHEAEQSLQGQRAARAALEQQRVETRNAIAVLRDGERWPESDEPQDLADITHPPLPEAVPAELLGRRPDLRAAELRLRRAFAQVDVVRTSYYPAFSLSAGASGSSTDLLDVLRDPVGSLGAALSLPFLDWNEMQLGVRASKVDLEIAISGFRQALHQAFAEVDNTLSARTQLALQESALAAALTEAAATERLYEVRYRAGAAPLRTWLEAQESRRSAEISLAQVRLDQFQNDVQMYQSLGGSAEASP